MARSLRRLAALALLALAAAGIDAQGSNDMPLSNGGEVLFLFSDPSVGAPAGTFPPDLLGGDQFWKVYPHEALQCAGGPLHVTGMWETFFDTDYATSDPFYDRIVGLAYARPAGEGVPACGRVPSWVALGGLDGSETLVSFGPSGLPSPCGVGATCTPGGCPPTGFVAGYTIVWSGLSIPVPCDGVHDVAVTYFLPGGMTTPATGPPGSCGQGDYVFQTDWSTNETPGDCCGAGVSPYSGLGLGGGFWIDPLSFVPEHHLAFDEVVLNVVAETDATSPSGGGRNGGGGLDGLCLDTSSGNATLATELRDLQTALAGGPSLALTAFSLRRLAPPGIDVLGAQLLIAPSGLLHATLGSGPVALVVSPLAAEGVFSGPAFPVPAGTAATLHAQGVVLDLATLLAQESQVWSVTTL